MEFLTVRKWIEAQGESNNPTSAILSATFYAPTPNFLRPSPADIIIPLSNLSPITADFFSIENDVGAVTQVTLPPDAAEAYIEVFCSGNSLEEFWYLSTSPPIFVQQLR